MTPFKTAAIAYIRAQRDLDVVDLRFVYDEGYSYSSYTFADPSFRVEATLRGGEVRWLEHDADMATFLNGLLDWEDTQ